MLSGCGKSDFYGEYSGDGKPRYNIKIMDNDTVTLNFDQMFTVEYEKNENRLEVIQDDVYYYYVDGVTEVFFELIDDDTLFYGILQNGKESEIGTFTRIEGSDGKSGETSVFWMTIKNMIYGLLIFLGMFIVIRVIFAFMGRE
ncbi:hypothetical protein KFZ58_18675 [Virgibacillus sp. NKC19-16]|nr:hypothetical protein KFZ58_18675 [Virgibacillus sp. NKC19-16]